MRFGNKVKYQETSQRLFRIKVSCNAGTEACPL
jgi:hypothetical protein